MDLRTQDAHQCRLQNKTEDCRWGLPRRVTNRKRLGWTPINSLTEFYVLLSCRVNVTLLLDELPLLGNLFSDDRLSDLADILLTLHCWQPKCDFFVESGEADIEFNPQKQPHQIFPFLSITSNIQTLFWSLKTKSFDSSSKTEFKTPFTQVKKH